MTMDQALAWATLILTVGGAVGIVWKIVIPIAKKTRSVLNALDRFTTDWFGEEPAPGRDAVPGVMERLNNIDGELKHNGGSTMKDALKRLEQNGKERDKTLDRIEQRLTQIDGRLEEGNKRFDTIETRLDNTEK